MSHIFHFGWRAGAAGLALSCAVAAGAAPDPGNIHSEEPLLKTDPPQVETQRLAWWEDARFGMFIHWGLYSQWGCHYPGPDGKLLDGHSEHMMQHLKIPLAQYAKIADVFNPVKFDANEWVTIAKNAGMKYIVITAKHHDGFAMFDSQASDYNIVARTPFKRDPVKELAEACRQQGLKFGVYYSLGRDWQDPDVPTRNGYRSNTWDYPDEKKKAFARYFERKAKPQIRELLTHYGPIAVLWFDTPEEINKEESLELFKMVRELQPDCIVNQRVGNRYGDYRVAEQQIPDAGYSDPWETCMTLNGHWGYYLGDTDYKPTEQLVRRLIDIASKGGNFLLNVGPTGEGVIPAGSVERLGEVGRWLKVNGEAIYGTTASPFKKLAWGRCTTKVTADGATLYLHVFDWPTDGRLLVPGLKNEVVSATLLADGKNLSSANDKGGVVITLPAAAPDKISSTVMLKVKGSLQIE
ncbi:MAG TPA: alpha-L-fucosidase [Opitutaceae bacterium]|nr:alpha-L-fucosidase [Opitutaceae bacterium]